MHHTGARSTPAVRVLQTTGAMPRFRYTTRGGFFRRSRAALIVRLALVACAPLAAACGDDAGTRGESDSTDSAASSRSSGTTAAVPETATLQIEGQPQTVPVQPFASGPDFPLPFRTLVPDGSRLVARAQAIPESESLDAEARFDWQPATDPAFLRLVVLDTTVSETTARGLIRAISTDFGVIGSGGLEYEEAVPPPGHDWATLGYRLRGVVGSDPVTGWISLGERAGRRFYFMALYPAEYADGLGPRFDFILEHWVWLDTGEPLRRSTGP